MVDKNLILTAMGEKKADVAVRGGKLVNVNTQEIYAADVAIRGSRIAYVGEVDHCIGEVTRIIDATGRYLVPGLIEPHVHPEASKLSMTKFAEAVLPRGTTTIFPGMDDIMGMAGIEGVKFVLEEVKRTPLKIYYTPYAKVPVTPGVGKAPSSTVPHKFGFQQLKKVSAWPETIGNMDMFIDFVMAFDKDTLDSIDYLLSQGMLVHGHDFLERGRRVQAFLTTGVRSDHVPVSKDEALEKLRLGMWVMFCDSFAHLLPDVIKSLTETKISTRHATYCTDDLDTRDILDSGHIDHNVRMAIQSGLDPIQAIQMGTLNAAEVHRMDHLLGSISPGRFADILLVEDLMRFKIEKVMANGELVAGGGRMMRSLKSPKYPASFHNTFHMKGPVQPADLVLRTDPDARAVKVLVIHFPHDDVRRYGKHAMLDVKSGVIESDFKKDILYCARVERHFKTGRISLSFVSGFNLNGGTIASSLVVPTHNVVCIGSNSEDMALAVNYLAKAGGGQVAVQDGRVLEAIHLPLLGIQSDVPPVQMAERERAISKVVEGFGCPISRPFFYLTFIDLPLAEYALSDRGILEYKTLKYVQPVLEIKTHK